MAEAERFDFEERFVADADLFEEIKTVEDELIEKYVRGWMNPADNSKFEKHFLTTEKRRERVEFSRQLINKIAEQAVSAPVKKNAELRAENISLRDRIAAFFLTPKIAMAGALALIFAVIGSWFLYQNFKSGTPEIVKNENTKNLETLTPTITPKPTVLPEIAINNNQQIPANNEETNSNENINKAPEKPEVEIKQPPTPIKTPVKKTAPNPVLALFAGTVRSEGKTRVLNLPKEANAATLQLNLESADYKTFQAELTDADGNVLFRQSNLKANRSKINFTIPAEKLERGDYIIKLNGKNASGENESVADFQFRVNQ
ncbi:hypothetical protein BH20ACI4_BH20ACI4_16920 [soil metagenome]